MHKLSTFRQLQWYEIMHGSMLASYGHVIMSMIEEAMQLPLICYGRFLWIKKQLFAFLSVAERKFPLQYAQCLEIWLRLQWLSDKHPHPDYGLSAGKMISPFQKGPSQLLKQLPAKLFPESIQQKYQEQLHPLVVCGTCEPSIVRDQTSNHENDRNAQVRVLGEQKRMRKEELKALNDPFQQEWQIILCLDPSST